MLFLLKFLDPVEAPFLINSRDIRPTWCSHTNGLILQTIQRQSRLVKGLWPTSWSQSPFPPQCPPEHRLLTPGPHAITVPLHLSVLPGLNGLCGWSINSVIQGVDSCSRVSVCSQACRRDGRRPAALCLPWSLIRLEVNGEPCAEVVGAWMEPPLTWRSHRGRTASDHCDTCSCGAVQHCPVACLVLPRGPVRSSELRTN